MPELTELERELAIAWDRDHLAVYAFETFSVECRAAWTELWEFVADLGWEARAAPIS